MLTIFDAFLVISEDLSLNFFRGSMPTDPPGCLTLMRSRDRAFCEQRKTAAFFNLVPRVLSLLPSKRRFSKSRAKFFIVVQNPALPSDWSIQSSA